MATGPEHYKRADEMMQALAEAADEGVDLPVAHAQTLLAQAQVHAMLALAAATAGGKDRADWLKVLGVDDTEDEDL